LRLRQISAVRFRRKFWPNPPRRPRPVVARFALVPSLTSVGTESSLPLRVSAVLRAKGRVGFSQNAPLITEKGGYRLAMFEPR
jgi:hypothetical protein